jgi:hypothetical protein
VVECPAGDATAATDWLTRAMVDGMAPLLRPVQVAVEVTSARTWA